MEGHALFRHPVIQKLAQPLVERVPRRSRLHEIQAERDQREHSPLAEGQRDGFCKPPPQRDQGEDPVHPAQDDVEQDRQDNDPAAG